MKKIIALVLSVLMLTALLVGCGTKSEKKANPLTDLNGDLNTIIGSIYENYEGFPTEFAPAMMPAEVVTADDDSVKYFTGLDNASKIKDVVVSEPMTGSQPYSVVLVRVNDAADAKTVAEGMFNGIDQRKWFCVEADVLRVVAVNDLVLLVMIGSTMTDLSVDTMVESFGKVCDQNFDVDLKK